MMAGENKEKKEKKEKIRQARQGKSSCMYAIFSLFVLVLLILHAYTMREKTADITGALGLIDMMFTVLESGQVLRDVRSRKKDILRAGSESYLTGWYWWF